MFNHLPQVSEDTLARFYMEELDHLLNSLESAMEELRRSNPCLAQIVETAMSSVGKDVNDEEPMERILTSTMGGLFVVLRVIDQALKWGRQRLGIEAQLKMIREMES